MERLRWLLAIFVLTSVLIFSSCSNGQKISHYVEGRADCLSCHGLTTDNPYPAGHAKQEYTNDRCTKCHQPGLATNKPEGQP